MQSIRGVGNEFAQENLALRVERMDEYVQQLCDFGLKMFLVSRVAFGVDDVVIDINPPDELNRFIGEALAC